MTNAYILVGKHEMKGLLKGPLYRGEDKMDLKETGLRLLALDRAHWLSTVNTVMVFRFRKWQRGAGPSDRPFASKGEPALGSCFFRSHSHLETFAK
jgi:hypothetical protein